MHEFVAAECDADVRRSPAHGFEKHEIAGLDIVAADAAANLILVMYFAGQTEPMLREDPLDESAAVEAVGVASAVAVGNTTI